jgi:DNA-binding XRE family transcriptional regulator
MRENKQKRLQAKGWTVGTVAEFLRLTPEEEAYVEIRLRLADGLKKRRIDAGVTQAALAKTVRSSQSRIAKMEAGDPTVSVDLLVRTLLALGATKRDVADLISGGPSSRAA